jgi:hypothetical protein
MKSPKNSNSTKKTIKQEYVVNPEQGMAALLAAMVAPKGYRFTSMKRKNKKAIATFTLVEN